MREALLDCAFGLAMYLTIMVGDSFDSCVYCADCRDALVYHFDVLGELVHRIFLKAAQAAKLANHHQVSRGVNLLAKCALANQLACTQSGKVGLLAEQRTFCRR
jgi:NADH:ubiquinone oxidoreductase subunit F (NADH-binding)